MHVNCRSVYFKCVVFECIDGHLGRPAWHGPSSAVPGPRLVMPARPD